MAQIQRLVTELKRYLKAQGLTYSQVADQLEMSESSVKRMFSRHAFTLERLEQICNIAGIEILDLVELVNQHRAYISELTLEQEEMLVTDPKLLLMAYHLITGWQLEQITTNFAIETDEASRLLVRLHRAKIIELLPLNRVKLLTSSNFRWRNNGPIQKLFRNVVQREFFDSTFTESAERLRFVGGMLSRAALIQMQQAIERIATEFDELNRKESSLPLDERHGCSAVFAIRPWEFSMFEQLRRSV